MDQNEQRDIAEELDAAMIPFRENYEKVFEAEWNIDDLFEHMRLTGCATVEQDNDGQIMLYTGLLEAPDKSLWREREKE